MGVLHQVHRLGVVLINTGSPDAPTPEAVRAYLETFLMDDHIRPLPKPFWRAILNHMILPKRSVASAEKYRSIWTDEGSPLVATGSSLAAKVEVLLQQGWEASSYCVRDLEGQKGVTDPFSCVAGAAHEVLPPLARQAMLYGSPSLRDTLAELRDAGCSELVIIPLYPQSAFSTTAAALDGAYRALDKLDWSPRVLTVESYGMNVAYLDAVAASISSAGYNPASDYLLLSFHAVPLPDIDRGDTYSQQVGASSQEIARRLGAASGTWGIAYQSPFEDGRRWTGPFTKRVIAQVAHESTRRLVVCCPGFSVDCLETLYDVEQVFRGLFLEARGSQLGDDFLYVPCLDDADEHARMLAHVVTTSLARDDE